MIPNIIQKSRRTGKLKRTFLVVDVPRSENVWQLMKIKIAKKKIRTVKALKGELTKEWNHLPTDLAAKLVESMIRRVTKLIESNGDYTMY